MPKINPGTHRPGRNKHIFDTGSNKMEEKIIEATPPEAPKEL